MKNIIIIEKSEWNHLILNIKMPKMSFAKSLTVEVI